jgi:GntR family transcriptional regulator
MILSQADGRAMYVQIMDEINRRVALGDWPPGHRLPSIRELAVDLKVSVITVKRAYLELERSGVIITQQGRGSWVSNKLDVDDVRKEELQRYLELAARLAAAMGIRTRDLIEMLEQYAQE